MRQDVQEHGALGIMDSKDKVVHMDKFVEVMEDGLQDLRRCKSILSQSTRPSECRLGDNVGKVDLIGRHLRRQQSGGDRYDAVSDDESISPSVGQPLDEDLYGASITSLLRDLHEVWYGPKTALYCLRLCRVTFTMFLLMSTVLLAVFLVAETKLMVTPDAVSNMRQVYSTYEEAMYGNHTYWTPNGFQRGLPGHFQPSLFSSLAGDFKTTICGMPLAHPFFTAAILAVWSFTVVVDLRTVISLSTLMVYKVHTVTSVEDIFTDSEGNPVLHLTSSSGVFYLEGLTVTFKIVLMMVVFLPRLLLDLCLLYLGCRWLLATQGLENLLLNAVALEFVLGLKDLFYRAVVPTRTMKATHDMVIRQRVREAPSCVSYLGSFSWLLVVAAWVFTYMRYLQGVLPEFHWDVAEVCHSGVYQMEHFLMQAFSNVSA